MTDSERERFCLRCAVTLKPEQESCPSCGSVDVVVYVNTDATHDEQQPEAKP